MTTRMRWRGREETKAGTSVRISIMVTAVESMPESAAVAVAA